MLVHKYLKGKDASYSEYKKPFPLLVFTKYHISSPYLHWILNMAFNKVVLAGGSGYLGRIVLDHLLTIPTISQLTVLTRSRYVDFPSSPIVNVVSIPSYQDVAALTLALEGHDLLISTLSGVATEGADEALVSAAIKAGVRRYMPSVSLNIRILDVAERSILTPTFWK